ncbi:MAG TPA: inorganic diphosphatase [Candidatus Lokiarchaeia archaeon]|nr:inorganic diphosphatase [Candidatus Lokiarchaeia archaeon]
MPGKTILPPFIIWKHIMPGPNPPERLYAIIECPKGSQVKYELSKTTNLILLNRILHSSVIYPQDYGFIPGTLAEDGDPLDIMVLISHPTFPRTLVECKPVGVLIMEDEQGIDNKILAVAVHDPFFADYDTIDDIPRHVMAELHEFFRTYKNLENPKYSDVKEWKRPDEAYKIIEKNIADFQVKFGDIAHVDPMAGLDEY